MSKLGGARPYKIYRPPPSVAHVCVHQLIFSTGFKEQIRVLREERKKLRDEQESVERKVRHNEQQASMFANQIRSQCEFLFIGYTIEIVSFVFRLRKVGRLLYALLGTVVSRYSGSRVFVPGLELWVHDSTWFDP